MLTACASLTVQFEEISEDAIVTTDRLDLTDAPRFGEMIGGGDSRWGELSGVVKNCGDSGTFGEMRGVVRGVVRVGVKKAAIRVPVCGISTSRLGGRSRRATIWGGESESAVLVPGRGDGAPTAREGLLALEDLEDESGDSVVEEKAERTVSSAANLTCWLGSEDSEEESGVGPGVGAEALLILLEGLVFGADGRRWLFRLLSGKTYADSAMTGLAGSS